MSSQASTLLAGPTIPPRGSSALARFFRADNRYLPPICITFILLAGNLSFGLLESFSRTALAIGTAILFEIALGLLVYRRIPNLASAYISGISVGILIRSPLFWPYALCSAIAITSKYGTAKPQFSSMNSGIPPAPAKQRIGFPNAATSRHTSGYGSSLDVSAKTSAAAM